MTTVGKPSLPSLPFRDVAHASNEDREIVHLLQAAQRSIEIGKSWAIGLTACHPREGVSSIAGGMAYVASRSQKSTLLCQIESRQQTRQSGTSDISQLLMQDVAAERLHEEVSWLTGSTLARTSLNDQGLLDILSSDGQRTQVIVGALRASFGQIVFDLPPLEHSPIAGSIGRFLDGVVIVIESERTSADTVRAASQSLRSSGANVLGAVLNKHRTHLPPRFSKEGR